MEPKRTLAYVSLRTLLFFGGTLSGKHTENLWVGYGGQNGSTMIGLNDSGGATFGQLGGRLSPIFLLVFMKRTIPLQVLPLWTPTNWWNGIFRDG
jgi:hypothetical protein